jgi:hypothetical protein
VVQYLGSTSKYPKILTRVVLGKPFFASIGERAQDSLIGFALDQASERASILQYVDCLMRDGALSERQKNRFLQCVDEMEFSDLRSAKLSFGVILKRLIAEMKSHNWYRQQPAISMLIDYGSEAVEKIDEKDQSILGRNILQVADGDEWSAKRFLQKLGDPSKEWPTPFIRGIAIECFVNESDQVRLKCDRLPLVLKILDGLDEDTRREIVDAIWNAIKEGTPKDVPLSKPIFENVRVVLGAYEWAAAIDEAIYRRRDDLIIYSDNYEIGTNG